MKKPILVFFAFSLLALGLAATPTPAAAKRLRVVASFTILADMVRQVGGDYVEVTSLVGPNGDPHAYEPSPEDAERLRKADVVFVNGLGLEGWMDRLISASGYRGKAIETSKAITPLKMEEDGKSTTDPHAWNSLSNGILYVRTIVEALKAADADDAAVFQDRGDTYVAALQKLDEDVRAEIASIPADRRKVVTTHDAFRYFGAAYGVSFLSPIGLSTETEASAADVARLIRQIRDEHVHFYFLENASDPRLVEQIARATGAKPGGELYVEALSEPDGPAPTYEKMFRNNVEQLVRAMRQ